MDRHQQRNYLTMPAKVTALPKIPFAEHTRTLERSLTESGSVQTVAGCGHYRSPIHCVDVPTECSNPSRSYHSNPTGEASPCRGTARSEERRVGKECRS